MHGIPHEPQFGNGDALIREGDLSHTPDLLSSSWEKLLAARIVLNIKTSNPQIRFPEKACSGGSGVVGLRWLLKEEVDPAGGTEPRKGREGFGRGVDEGRGPGEKSCLATPPLFIPSSHDVMGLMPLGSHPLLEPVWALGRDDLATAIERKLSDVERNLAGNSWRCRLKRFDKQPLGGSVRRAYRKLRGRADD